MQWIFVSFALFAGLGAGLPRSSVPLDGGRTTVEQEAPDCVKVRGEPRFQGYGQTHVVIVKNTCDRRMGCEIFTDVDPTPRHRIVIPAGSMVEVPTRQGSPASEFTPGYYCQYR